MLFPNHFLIVVLLTMSHFIFAAHCDAYQTAQANEQDNVNYVKQAFNSVPLPGRQRYYGTANSLDSLQMLILKKKKLLFQVKTMTFPCERKVSSSSSANLFVSLYPCSEVVGNGRSLFLEDSFA